MENAFILSLFDEMDLQPAIQPSSTTCLSNITDIQSIKIHIIHILANIMVMMALIMVMMAPIMVMMALIMVMIALIMVMMALIMVMIALIMFMIALIMVMIALIMVMMALIMVMIALIMVRILSIPEPIRIKRRYNPVVIQHNLTLQIIGVQLLTHLTQEHSGCVKEKFKRKDAKTQRKNN